MGLTAIYARDRGWRAHLCETVGSVHETAESASWSGFQRLIRERPVTAAVADLESVGSGGSAVSSLLRFRSRFPGLGLLVLVRRHRDPGLLFRLGTVGIHNLLLVDLDGVDRILVRSVARSLERGVTALVTRAVSSYLPARELDAVRLALDGVHRRWSAEDFAEEVGLSRPFLSECLKDCGLPTVGKLLLWTRLLHAGYWLTDPGRTAESVARQLEYCDGSAFRRALRSHTGATPTEVVESGGFPFVLRRFLDTCEFGRDREALDRRFSAA
ncbi:MAG: AraC family transcriptional regulator [Longimicrobiales bacterium]|nr:AraC family transcriptional regulator [Longimicrobiales bacterium]